MNRRRRWVGGALLAAAALEVARRLVSRVERVEVAGDSMAPALLAGDRLLVLRGGRLRPGCVVALDDPREPGRVPARVPARVMVKRVVSLTPAGVTAHGDNSDSSTDSRHFGLVDIKAVHGPVFYRYGPADRVGRLTVRSHTTRW